MRSSILAAAATILLLFSGPAAAQSSTELDRLSRGEIQVLAEKLIKERKYKEVEPYLRRLIELETRDGGVAETLKWGSRLRLGIALTKQNRSPEAVDVLTRLISDIREVHGEDTSLASVAYFSLSQAKLSLKEPREAEKSAKVAVRIMEKRFGKNHWSLKGFLLPIAQAKIMVGEYADAEPILLRAQKIQQEAGVRNNSGLARTTRRLLEQVRKNLEKNRQ